LWHLIPEHSNLSAQCSSEFTLALAEFYILGCKGMKWKPLRQQHKCQGPEIENSDGSSGNINFSEELVKMENEAIITHLNIISRINLEGLRNTTRNLN
jgi:hypothetical protein